MDAGSPKYTDADLKRAAGIQADLFDDKLAAINEALGNIRQMVNRLPAVEDDLAELKSDIRAIKAAITDTNKDLQLLDQRVASLEAAA